MTRMIWRDEMPTFGGNTEKVLCENCHSVTETKVEQEKIVLQLKPYLEPIVKKRLAQSIALKLESVSTLRIVH